MKPILSFSLLFSFFKREQEEIEPHILLVTRRKRDCLLLLSREQPVVSGGVEREVKRKTIEANKKESAQAGLLLIALTVCPASSWGVSIFWRLDSLGSLESLSHTLGFSTWLQCQMMMQFDFTAAEGNIARILMYSVVVWHFL
jgi:hypothetical protein